MLDCQASGNNSKEGDTVNCKHCQVQRKTGFSYRNARVLPTRGIKRRINGSGDNQVYWGIQLDQDLLETIISIYPEWFKDYNLNLNTMADGNGNTSSTENSGLSTGTGKVVIPLLQTQDLGSPPKAEVDEASLQKAMDRNKESLKVKLMLRRPLNQLVEQGIMPSLKTSPAFHEQRQKLERAKMGDFLKNKIQRRPDRQELIQQHILEDTTVDPSLQDKQRQLKKARLADDLNDRLSHRPGPLELIKGNILQTDETFAQAVKEGQIPFKRTCEGETRKHPPPPRFLVEDDSGSDGALSPPQDCNDQSQSSPASIICSLPSMETGESSPATNQGSPESVIDVKVSVVSSPPSSIASPIPCHVSTSATPTVALTQSSGITIQSPVGQVQSQSRESSNSSSGGSSSKNRKKSKSKAQPKTRTIKFHEYKGPPNAQKNQNFNNISSETSYDLLLQQQQLFLQWQLEWQQKYPQIILPAAQKSNGDQCQGITSNQMSTSQSSQSQSHDPITSPHRTLSKLEDMKVSDLKAELKKRNLPVSGSKPQLIERLKPYADTPVTAVTSSVSTPHVDCIATVPTSASPSLPVSVGGILIDTLPTVTPKSEAEPPPISPLVAMDTTASSTLPPAEASVGVYKVPSVGTPVSVSRPPSVVPMDVDNNSNNAVDAMEVNDAGTVGNVIIHSSGNLTNEDIVKLQQRQIEELQRELQRFLPMVSMPDSSLPDVVTQWQWSQLQLQQQQQHVLFHPHQQQAVLTTTGGVTVPLATAAAHPNLQQQTQAQIDSTVATTTASNIGTPIDGKLLQRQILQQHLQQKIQQQQIFQQLQQQQQQQSQQQQLQHSGTTSILPSASASAAVKASLAAFLHSQHATTNAGTVSNTMPPPPTGPSQTLATFPTAVVATQVLTTNPAIKVEPNENISATLQPVLLCQTAPVSTPVTTSLSMTPKTQPNSLPNGLAGHQRTSSLPNFSSLITGKTAPVRTNTEPQFIITKPPPDYAEATKQLNKCKQQFPVSTPPRNNSSRSGRQKSVKSQAVDDVLEILIKNGELPPSAAQEPATPTTPETSKPGSSINPPLFPVSVPVSTPTVLSASDHSTASPGLSNIANSVTPIHSPSPLTTPSPTRVSSSPAAVLGDVDNNAPAGLDFDFHLDLDDIDNMDLGVLGNENSGNENTTQKSDVVNVPSSSSSPMTMPCQTTTLNSVQNMNQNQVPQPPLMLGEIMDFQDIGVTMDMELNDWLDVVMPPTTPVTMPSTSSGTFSNPQTSYSNVSEHDPLLSNMVNSHDPFDLFSIDDMDFKAPTDLNALTWDKVDFAT